jgi:Flp pilus assembly protein TadG
MKSAIPVNRRKRQGGNAIVEFSLCATVLLMMACGVTDFARLFNAANMATGAAEAGLAYASIGPENWTDYDNIQKSATNDTGNYPGATATASNFCTCGVGTTQGACPATCGNGVTYQQYVKVSVTIPFKPMFNYPGVPDPINITQVACARVR